MSGAGILYSHSASVTDATASASIALDTRFVDSIALDLNVVAFVAGTAPTISYFIDRQGADGTWYQVWTSGALAATGIVSVDIGRHAMTYAAGSVTAAHAIFTNNARFRWAFGGTANPTSVTWSASLVGRG